MGIKKLEVVFFRTELGAEPVREWLKDLPKAEKKKIGEEIKTVQFGWPLGMPLVRSLRRDLWEIRVRLGGLRIARLIFFIRDNSLVLLNAFIKKSRKTPQKEIDLALSRKRLVEGGK